jgi:large subunit ribosomal protein L15
MQTHNLKRTTRRQKSRSVGRGGKRGKTSGRGTKGQKARAGHKMRPELRDIIMKVPKLRGYRFKSRQKKAVPISLESLEKFFLAGETVNPESLKEKGLIEIRGGVTPRVKILSEGEISKKLTISGCEFSLKAKEKIEKSGGTVANPK